MLALVIFCVYDNLGETCGKEYKWGTIVQVQISMNSDYLRNLVINEIVFF